MPESPNPDLPGDPMFLFFAPAAVLLAAGAAALTSRSRTSRAAPRSRAAQVVKFMKEGAAATPAQPAPPANMPAAAQAPLPPARPSLRAESSLLAAREALFAPPALKLERTGPAPTYAPPAYRTEKAPGAEGPLNYFKAALPAAPAEDA